MSKKPPKRERHPSWEKNTFYIPRGSGCFGLMIMGLMVTAGIIACVAAAVMS